MASLRACCELAPPFMGGTSSPNDSSPSSPKEIICTRCLPEGSIFVSYLYLRARDLGVPRGLTPLSEPSLEPRLPPPGEPGAGALGEIKLGLGEWLVYADRALKQEAQMTASREFASSRHSDSSAMQGPLMRHSNRPSSPPNTPKHNSPHDNPTCTDSLSVVRAVKTCAQCIARSTTSGSIPLLADFADPSSSSWEGARDRLP
eukprot:CAMPEP_0173218120 /NCGR_PEP_ID=MMETSP1142-20121109/875_1 /TAXON_ID=483371 /ORGANISM="non described non described, Strain CCMP2298" /LENGTH=202 /DNA_ID=CAMNT_0014145777 /DNA_START=260 /DNA_END=865 /DNA_ORIENTATION=-